MHIINYKSLIVFISLLHVTSLLGSKCEDDADSVRSASASSSSSAMARGAGTKRGSVPTLGLTATKSGGGSGGVQSGRQQSGNKPGNS